MKSQKDANKSRRAKCEICSTKTFLEIHHIEGREIPNFNNPSNLSSICPNCHNEIHMGYLVLEGWFKTTSGKELLWHTNDEESFSGTDIVPYIIPNKSVNKCTCHDRDSSYTCEYCHSQGFYGHMEEPD